ncbi:MAG: sorbosone dehydrogenase family protein [Candidatus Abyssobacteria bacterium SURF_5]|uniref:Sorbosone dehydrogenase family protein n=1 Tax=Abyssobacteria bacterium (strain SURF_5) TaxID=2093360 RepID=A0A3A4NYT8_ABYX5|nr:MAG: sorbosone dehydrogenase family protein [Candidatus Abyssubacteria bacterium SURF_5]
MAKNFVLLIAVVEFIFFSCGISDAENTQLPLHLIKLPAGFEIAVYANDIPGARSMTLGKNGTLFVGTRNEGKVYAVLDNDNDSKADEVITIAGGLNMPNGVAFRDGSLYVAEINRIIRFDRIEENLQRPPDAVVVNDSFPADRSHGWKFIRFGPDGKLYVPVGMPCNICVRENPRYGTIMRMNPDGYDLEIFARGIRNTVGFDWHPKTGVLWFTDNGRDRLSDDLPPDELNYAPQEGMHFGFPYCYGKNTPDPFFEEEADCRKYVPAAMNLGPHVAALGMRFYTGEMFPSEYRTQIFIAEHGSWNRTEPIGYRVMLVRLEDNKPAALEVFADGWLQDSDKWGRPVDVQVMPDGALLVSDDHSGSIYRISYSRQP